MCLCTTQSSNCKKVNLWRSIIEKKYIIIIPLLLTALCGCATNTNNNTNDIAENKTYLYNYDYETDSNGEVSTAYNEEKPSVDANEPQITEEPIVKLNKNSIKYIKMNETYNTGSFDYTILKVYSTISKSFATELVDEEYIQPVMNQLNLQTYDFFLKITSSNESYI